MVINYDNCRKKASKGRDALIKLHACIYYNTVSCDSRQVCGTCPRLDSDKGIIYRFDRRYKYLLQLYNNIIITQHRALVYIVMYRPANDKKMCIKAPEEIENSQSQHVQFPFDFRNAGTNILLLPCMQCCSVSRVTARCYNILSVE